MAFRSRTVSGKRGWRVLLGRRSPGSPAAFFSSRLRGGLSSSGLGVGAESELELAARAHEGGSRQQAAPRGSARATEAADKLAVGEGGRATSRAASVRATASSLDIFAVGEGGWGFDRPGRRPNRSAPIAFKRRCQTSKEPAGLCQNIARAEKTGGTKEVSRHTRGTPPPPAPPHLSLRSEGCNQYMELKSKLLELCK